MLSSSVQGLPEVETAVVPASSRRRGWSRVLFWEFGFSYLSLGNPSSYFKNGASYFNNGAKVSGLLPSRDALPDPT